MGEPKESLHVGGVALVQRIIGELIQAGWSAAKLGGEPVPGIVTRPDRERWAGPLSALRWAEPVAEWNLVISCDIPLFRAEVAEVLYCRRAGVQAVVPVVGGRPQPLCAIYHETAFQVLQDRKDLVRVMEWLGALESRLVDEDELGQAGVSPDCFQGCNTRSELQALLDRAGHASS